MQQKKLSLSWLEGFLMEARDILQSCGVRILTRSSVFFFIFSQ